MTHRALDIAFGHFAAMPCILPAAEDVPAGHDFAAHVVAPSDIGIGVDAARSAPFEVDTGSEGAGGGIEAILGGPGILSGGLDGRIEVQRGRKRHVLVAGHRAEAARRVQVGRLEADGIAVLRAGLIEALSETGKRRFRGLDPLTRLLEIAFAGTAAIEARLHVLEQGPVHAHVVLGDRDQPGVARHVDVGFRRIECEQLGAFMDASRGRVHAGGLAPDLVDRGETVKQDLAGEDGDRAPVQPLAATERCRRNVLAESLRAIAGLDAHLRQQRSLLLAQFGFSRPAVRCSFADAWMGLDSLLERIIDGERRLGV